jgi:hypothetical protein
MQSKFWYRDSRRAIKRIYGKDWKLMCGLLACTSPRVSLKSNVTIALKAYNLIKAGQVPDVGFIKAHSKGIAHYLKTGLPKGRKTRPFYLNLLGQEQHVTVDLWVVRYSGIAHAIPNAQEHSLIVDKIKEEAERLGLTPAQRQAEIWCSIRPNARYGYSYATVINQYRMALA